MGIMCSIVKDTGLVTFDIGVGDNGRPVYRVSWFNGERWGYEEYRSFKTARATYKLVSRMI